MITIPDNLTPITSTKYGIQVGDVYYCMLQIPQDENSVFQFEKGGNKEMLVNEIISSIMTWQEVQHLMNLMQNQTEHAPVLEFEKDGGGHHWVKTDTADELVILLQLMSKYFYHICMSWKSINNIQQLQKKMEAKKPKYPKLEESFEPNIQADQKTDE